MAININNRCRVEISAQSRVRMSDTDGPLIIEIDDNGFFTVVSDIYNVDEWNTFFDLPTYGIPFKSVSVSNGPGYFVGPTKIIELYGGDHITIKSSLFDNSAFNYVNIILNINDKAGCIRKLEANAFNSQDLLTLVYMPNLVEAAEYSFYYCLSLIGTFPNLTIARPYCFFATNSVTANNLLTAEDNSFNGCQNPTLPNLITALGDYTLNGCNTIDFPKLKTAGNYCFQGSSVNSINLPSLEYAGDACFQWCTNLTSVDLPNLVTSAGSLFSGCTSLTSVNLPRVEFLGGYSFYQTSISSIDLPNCTTILDGSFMEVPTLTYINIPKCTVLGQTVGNDNVFFNSGAAPITAIFNSFLQTNNVGLADGDIQYLISARPGSTITYV